MPYLYANIAPTVIPPSSEFLEAYDRPLLLYRKLRDAQVCFGKNNKTNKYFITHETKGEAYSVTS